VERPVVAQVGVKRCLAPTVFARVQHELARVCPDAKDEDVAKLGAGIAFELGF